MIDKILDYAISLAVVVVLCFTMFGFIAFVMTILGV